MSMSMWKLRIDEVREKVIKTWTLTERFEIWHGQKQSLDTIWIEVSIYWFWKLELWKILSGSTYPG